MSNIESLNELIFDFSNKVHQINEFMSFVDSSIELPEAYHDYDEGISLSWRSYKNGSSVHLTVTFYGGVTCFEFLQMEPRVFYKGNITSDKKEVLDILDKYFKKE